MFHRKREERLKDLNDKNLRELDRLKRRSEKIDQEIEHQRRETEFFGSGDGVA